MDLQMARRKRCPAFCCCPVARKCSHNVAGAINRSAGGICRIRDYFATAGRSRVVMDKIQGLAAWIIALSMFGSFVFGVINHYILVSPDNVMVVPAHAERGAFIVSAAL